MPTRPRHARNNNNKTRNGPAGASSSESTPLDSPALSPPTHLPTPLPEEEDSVGHHHHERRAFRIGNERAAEPRAEEEMQLDVDVPHLIDFEDPTTTISMPVPELAPSARPTFYQDYPHNEDNEDQDEPGPSSYRSPPFIEAQLPQEEDDGDDEESALPVPPPRIVREGRRAGIDFAGHVRSPTINSRSVSQSSAPSSRSPSSISPRTHSNPTTSASATRPFPPIPSATPYPPLVSRPVSFGVMTSRPPTSPRHEDQDQDAVHGGEKRKTGPRPVKPVPPAPARRPQTIPNVRGPRQEPHEHEEYGYGYEYRRGEYERELDAEVQQRQAHQQHRATRSQGSAGLGVLSGLSKTLRRGTSPLRPRVGGEFGVGVGEGVDKVVWARWDRLGGRPHLILGYTTGLQIWDTSSLGEVREVLNLNLSDQEEWTGPDVSIVGVVKAGFVERRGAGRAMRGLGETVVPGEEDGGEEGVLGILLETRTEGEAQTGTMLVVYSVKRDRVVGRWVVPGGAPQGFECGEGFVVVSTSAPVALHIVSTTTWKTLRTIPGTKLASFIVPLQTSKTNLQVPSYISTAYYSATASSSSSAVHPPHHPSSYSSSSSASPGSRARVGADEESGVVAGGLYRGERAHAVYAVRGRLLAYAVPSSAGRDASVSPTGSGVSPSSAASSPAAFYSGAGDRGRVGGTGGVVASPSTLGKMIGLPTTQKELGSAVGRVGGSVVKGMKFLGGIALEAAKNRIAQPPTTTFDPPSATEGLRGFFSRSAPSAGGGVGVGEVESEEERKKRRRFSGVPPVYDHQREDHHLANPYHTSKGRTERGYVVVVVDLAALVEGSGDVKTVAEFVGSRSQPIAKLAFSQDGCTVLVVPRDGYVTKVFQLRPGDVGSGSEGVVPLYELRRGRMTAVVEDIKVVGDGRWTGVATRNRTVHVFPTNPLGGRPHHASHLEGRVRNADGVQNSGKLELSPLVRLYGSKLSTSAAADDDGASPPPLLSFSFVDPNETSLPPSLAPPVVRMGIPPVSDPTASPPLSPRQPRTPKNYQDVLLFDAATGVLALQRVTVEQRQKDHASSPAAVGLGMVSAALSGTSLSLSVPGMGGAGPLQQSVSSSFSSNSGQGKGGVAGTVKVPPEEVYDLVGRASVLATWDLRRKKNWEEIRGVLVASSSSSSVGLGLRGSEECLAQAELSTCSRSARTALTRPIYLSHQFSFQALGEDYHALIRRYRLDVNGTKIDVRKDVPIHAFTSASSPPGADVGTGESFVEGFSPPLSRMSRRQSHHPVSSSFDEPLASALAGELDYQPPAAVLPMYPNGVPGSNPRSFRNSIPIRTMAAGLGDGVSEGLGKIRRMQQRVRSPRLGPTSGDGYSPIHGEDVLLEFDEEVDDFMAPRVVDSGSASANIFDDDVVGKVDEEIWDGWDQQDKLAVEEAEQFHTISTAQYLDDTPAVVVGTSKVTVVRQPKKSSKKRK